jgi:hypothetical protein
MGDRVDKHPAVRADREVARLTAGLLDDYHGPRTLRVNLRLCDQQH